MLLSRSVGPAAGICLTPVRRMQTGPQIWTKETMNRFKVVTLVGCLALLGGILAPGVKADEWNRKTVVKFNAPVEIPGIHLAGWGM